MKAGSWNVPQPEISPPCNKLLTVERVALRSVHEGDDPSFVA